LEKFVHFFGIVNDGEVGGDAEALEKALVLWCPINRLYASPRPKFADLAPI
jgi:hypothetical protein